MVDLSMEITFMKTKLERMRRHHLIVAYTALVLGILISVGIFLCNKPMGTKFLISAIAMFLASLVFVLVRKLLKGKLEYLDKKIKQMTSSLLNTCASR